MYNSKTKSLAENRVGEEPGLQQNVSALPRRRGSYGQAWCQATRRGNRRSGLAICRLRSGLRGHAILRSASHIVVNPGRFKAIVKIHDVMMQVSTSCTFLSILLLSHLVWSQHVPVPVHSSSM